MVPFLLRTLNVQTVAIPHRIGCGLAGRHWNTYLELIREFALSCDIQVKMVSLIVLPFWVGCRAMNSRCSSSTICF
jgi:hypothetical protein